MPELRLPGRPVAPERCQKHTGFRAPCRAINLSAWRLRSWKRYPQCHLVIYLVHDEWLRAIWLWPLARQFCPASSQTGATPFADSNAVDRVREEGRAVARLTGQVGEPRRSRDRSRGHRIVPAG